MLTPHGPSPKVSGPKNGASSSYNWSGNVATGKKFTQVMGEWTVPAVTASRSPEYAASWVGIGGDGSPQLIQTGTTGFTSTTTTTYYSWYEMLPSAPVPIGAVAPGDLMSARISQGAGTTWTITIMDLTSKSSFSKSFTYAAGSATSAEWIVERPLLVTTTAPTGFVFSTLANFGSTSFEGLGVTPEVTSSTVGPVYMISTKPADRIIAYPGLFETGFTDYYGTPTPTVTSVSPSLGPTAGGTSVTITGTYLVPGLVQSVHFGSEAAPGTINGKGVLTVTSPAQAAGTVDVTVTTTDGTTAMTSADRFTYVGPPAPTPSAGSGYDLVGSDGGVFVFPTGGSGGFYGSLPGLGVHVNDVVGMVPTSNDQGYFLVGADGGVFSFGNAPYLGSLPGLGVKPAQPITGIVPTATDGGYFLVGKDGGVYAFGNAPFLGSLPGSGVHTDNVIGIAATPSGNGYWLVTATGIVYAYGAARQLGSATGSTSPVSAIAGTPTGGGYWIVMQNGSVDAFGDARYFGSLPALGITPAKPVIGIVHTSGTGGYWLIGSDGGIFAFGNAGFVGSLPGLGVDVSDIVGAVPTGG